MIYVEQRRDSVTGAVAKGMFWSVLLWGGSAILLCVLGCCGLWAVAIGTDDLPPIGSTPRPTITRGAELE